MSRRLGTWVGMRAWWMAFALWACVASNTLAQAAGDVALVDQAEQLAAHGDHQAAVALLRVVIDRAPTPKAFGVLGLASLRADDPVTAESAIQRALQTPADPWVKGHKAELNAALVTASRTLGTLIVDGAPDGAAVRVDDREAGAAPLPPVRVRAGNHQVAVGFVRRTVVVSAGATASVDMSTATSSAPSTPSAASTPSTPAATPTPSTPSTATARSLEVTPEPEPSPATSDNEGARIPASWLQALPAAGTDTVTRPIGWSDAMRINVGIALGLRLSFGLIETHFERDGRNVYPFHDRTSARLHADNWSNFDTGTEIVLGGTWIMGISQQVELAPRFDLIVSPGLANLSGHSRRNTDESDICCLYDLYFDSGDAWIIAPVLVPGLRIRPHATSPFYVGTALRFGYLHASATVQPASYRGAVEKQDITIDQWLVGGELALGSSFGDDLVWDLSARVQVDTGGFVSLIAFERRVY